jgi:RNA-directed DNA polymerase
MGEHPQHVLTGRSRNRQTPSVALVPSSRPPPAIHRSGSKKTAIYAVPPLKVCNCVSGAISPILSNVFLHDVLDVWFERDVKPRLNGRAHLVRYADDVVIVFACEEDARRVLAVLPKRFAKYGLTIHPEKTRLVEFRRPDRPPPNGRDGDRPGTFDLLGFTHYWSLSRKGKWVVKQRTASDRFCRALKRVAEWCRGHRHLEVKQQWETLKQKLRGHFGYYGIIGNLGALTRFHLEVVRVWRKWLDRRSQRARMNWDRMNKLLKRYPLPRARIVRPHPTLA